MQSRTACVLAAAGTALPLLLSGTANAGPLAQVIVTRFNTVTGAPSPVPGLPAQQVADAAAAGTVISWSNPQFASPGLSTVPAIDAQGNVAFYGQMAAPVTSPPPLLTPIITTGNQNAVFYSPRLTNYAFSGIQIVARDGSATGTPQGGPTPSNPQGWVLNNTSGGNGINAGVGMSSSGQMLVTGQLNGVGATSTTNTAFFTGAPSALAQAAIRGGAAPGTGGGTYATNLNFSAINNAVNPSGQVAFSSAVAGGDTVAGQNDSGLFVASPAGASIVMRRGDAAPGAGGAVFGVMTTNPGSTRINASGAVAFANNLSTTAGTTPATVGTDGVLYTNAGGSLSLVAREGGLVGGSSSLAAETYLSNTNTSGTPHASVSTQSFNNSGTVLYTGRFNTSANVGATNNEALMTWRNGAATPLYQTGSTAAPGVAGGTFSSLGFQNSQARLNNQDHAVFAATLTADGAAATTANDQGLWFTDTADPGSALLIAREGMAAPGAGGATFGNGFFGVIMNNADIVVFQSTLSDSRNGWFAWVPGSGLMDLVIAGDTSILGPSYPVTAINYNSTGNGDGGVMSLNDSGMFTFFASSTGGPMGNNGAIVVMQIPAPAGGVLAFFGLAAASRRRRGR